MNIYIKYTYKKCYIYIIIYIYIYEHILEYLNRISFSVFIILVLIYLSYLFIKELLIYYSYLS